MKVLISVICNECLDMFFFIWYVNYIFNRWKEENKIVNEYMVYCELISNIFMYKVVGIECKYKNKLRFIKCLYYLIM